MASFSQAFADALAEKGTGQTFTWNGKQYSTNLASGKKVGPKVNPQIKDMAGKGNDKPSPAPKTSIKPKTRNSNKPVVDSTAPTQPKPVTAAPTTRMATAKATVGAGAGTNSTKGTMSARNISALKKGATNAVSKAKEVLTKGYAVGSAYDLRQKKNALEAKRKAEKGVTAVGVGKTGAGISASNKAPSMSQRNVSALKRGATELVTKGYVTGSAYDMRKKAAAQKTKDIEKALFDQRLARAGDEEAKFAILTRKGK